MNTSTIEARRSPGKRLSAILVGFAVALAGTLAFSGGQAQASDPFGMTFNNARINLGIGFTGGTTKFLPAPAALPGQASNPAFNPANPVSESNSPTVFSETATPLPNYNALDPATFTRPSAAQPTQAVNNFSPIGCGTPVSFGIYFAVVAGETPGPDSIIYNPAPAPGNPFSPLLGQPLANAGVPGAPEYYRVLPKGAILEEGADSVTFANPFAAIPGQPATRTLTAPYPAADTLWRPYAASGGNLATPGSIVPQGKGGVALFDGTAGLRGVPNPVTFCPNPETATVQGNVGVGGNVVLDQDEFEFPISVLDVDSTGLAADVYAPVTLIAEENLIGRFDSATGALSVSGEMSARVLLGLSYDPLGSYCKVSLGNMTLTTGPSAPRSSGFLGSAFTTGATSVEKLQGPGALTGTWNIQATDVTPVGTASATSSAPVDCERTALLGAGPGGVWLSTNAVDPAPYPNAKLGLTMKANKKAVRRGGKVSIRVTAANSGIVVGNANVRLAKSGKPKAKVAKRVNLGEVEAGGSKSRSVTVTVNRKAKKGKITIKGTLAGKTKKVTVRVK